MYGRQVVYNFMKQYTVAEVEALIKQRMEEEFAPKIYLPSNVERELKKERAALEQELVLSDMYKSRYWYLIKEPHEMTDSELRTWVKRLRNEAPTQAAVICQTPGEPMISG
jgi:hypothetical protein